MLMKLRALIYVAACVTTLVSAGTFDEFRRAFCGSFTIHGAAVTVMINFTSPVKLDIFASVRGFDMGCYGSPYEMDDGEEHGTFGVHLGKCSESTWEKENFKGMNTDMSAMKIVYVKDPEELRLGIKKASTKVLTVEHCEQNNTFGKKRPP